MENELKELNKLIDVANAINGGLYECTLSLINKEKKEYNINEKIDCLYYMINTILKNSEDTSILENKIYDILCIRSSADADDDSIIEFYTQEDQIIWDNLSPWLHNGYSGSSYNDEWVNQVYPNDKPEFYGVYRIRGY